MSDSDAIAMDSGSMGIASVMSALLSLSMMTSSTTICRSSLRCSGVNSSQAIADFPRPCRDVCPSCVESPTRFSQDAEPDKSAAIGLLDMMIGSRCLKRSRSKGVAGSGVSLTCQAIEYGGASAPPCHYAKSF